MLKNIFGLVFFFSMVFAANAQTSTKFNDALRQEFERGMSGDEQSFESAMKKSAEILAQNPKDAETLVWHGAATLVLAGQAFQKGDLGRGDEYWKKGMAEMGEAVSLEPENFQVLNTRGSVVLQASKRYPVPEESARLRKIAIGDYQKILSNAQFAQFPESIRGQILIGLAEAFEGNDDKAMAKLFYQRTADETTKGTVREKALKWLEANKN